MNAHKQMAHIIEIVVVGLLLGILLPISLNDILAYTSDVQAVQILVSTVIPIVAVIGIISYLVHTEFELKKGNG